MILGVLVMWLVSCFSIVCGEVLDEVGSFCWKVLFYG